MRHHPQGPSRQKNLEPSQGGCEGFLPMQSNHANIKLGAICHEIWDKGYRFLAEGLPGPEFALGLVDNINFWWGRVERDFEDVYGPINYRANEAFLKVPHINFGTTDRLRMVGSKAALLGDGKFGSWKVEHAQNNLQGHNYAVLVWEMYPEVEDIWVWFGNPRLEDYTLGKFTRKRDYQRLKDALVTRIHNAQNPEPSRFNYNELNCSFCSRWECPIRLLKAKTTITDLTEIMAIDMTNDELATVKRGINPLKTLLKGVDEEAKRRVTLEGELLPGFEQKEKVHRRDVIGLPNVNVLRTYLGAHSLYGISQRVDELLSISWSDVEQLIIHACGGDNKKARPIISEIQQELRDAGALTETKYYTVVAINDESQIEQK